MGKIVLIFLTAVQECGLYVFPGGLFRVLQPAGADQESNLQLCDRRFPLCQILAVNFRPLLNRRIEFLGIPDTPFAQRVLCLFK